MSSYRVLNTRPAHQANSLTRLIEDKGGFVFNLPVFDIHPVKVNTENLNEFDCIIFLSANAVMHFLKEKVQNPARMIAIGPATQFALEKMGIENIILPSQFSSDGILSLREMQSVKNKKIAIVCGEHSKSLLPDTLKKRGAEIKSIVCYRRNPIAYDMDIIFKKITDSDINCIVSTSLESYFALLLLFKNPLHRAWLLKKTICVISDEMRQQATADGFARVIQADNATNDAIMAVL